MGISQRIEKLNEVEKGIFDLIDTKKAESVNICRKLYLSYDGIYRYCSLLVYRNCEKCENLNYKSFAKLVELYADIISFEINPF